MIAGRLGCVVMALLGVRGLGQEAAPVAPAEAAKKASASRHEQAAYAVVFCTVWDPEGHPLYGVRVQLRRAGEKKFHLEAYSDHQGELAFRVPAGKMDYELAVDPKSLKILKEKGLVNREPVKVHVEYDEQVDTGVHLTK
jgi:hypothetical protein